MLPHVQLLGAEQLDDLAEDKIVRRFVAVWIMSRRVCMRIADGEVATGQGTALHAGHLGDNGNSRSTSWPTHITVREAVLSRRSPARLPPPDIPPAPKRSSAGSARTSAKRSAIAALRASGVNVALTTGKLTHADLAPKPHTHLLASVADLPGVIGALTR